MNIRLPKDFYVFYSDNVEIDSGCYPSNQAAIEASEKLVLSTGKAVSVMKGIARVVPCVSVKPANTASTGQVAIAPADAGSNHPFGLSVKTADVSSAATRR